LHPESFPGQIPRRGAIFWGSVSDLWSSHAAIEITFLHFEIQVKKTVKVRYLRRRRVFCQKSVKELKNLKNGQKVFHNDEKQRWNTLVSSEELKTVKRSKQRHNYLGGLGEKSKSEKNDQKTTKKPLKTVQKWAQNRSKRSKEAQNDPKRPKSAKNPPCI